jgi:hypothetical protein
VNALFADLPLLEHPKEFERKEFHTDSFNCCGIPSVT